MSYFKQDVFLADVSNHNVILLKDDGVHRCLEVRSHKSLIDSYSIVTYPGGLLFTGDRGSYVFEATQDMFNFFADDLSNNKGNLDIRPNYWSEKLVACCCYANNSEKGKVFTYNAFKKGLKDYVLDYTDSMTTAHPIVTRILGDIGEVHEHNYLELLSSYSCDEVDFTDFFEVDCTEYCPRYIWACYAIVWAIKKYRNMSVDNK